MNSRYAGLVARPLVIFVLSAPALAGPFAPAAGQAGSTAIAKDDPSFTGWATGVTIARGPKDIVNPSLGLASYGADSNVLGPAQGISTDVVSLGDGGSATLTFAQAMTDGLGFDFAVFENGFGDAYLELAFVEVSSDGSNFFRFPSVSLTPTTTQLDSFGALDPTDLHNLAGKYRQGFGTPFDLSDLVGISPLLDVSNVTHVRIVDVVGNIHDPYATFDSQNNRVNDPWPTAFASGGFDLDAVGVIHTAPEPASLALLSLAAVALAYRRSRSSPRR